jgi:hypothetical protein
MFEFTTFRQDATVVVLVVVLDSSWQNSALSRIAFFVGPMQSALDSSTCHDITVATQELAWSWTINTSIVLKTSGACDFASPQAVEKRAYMLFKQRRF